MKPIPKPLRTYLDLPSHYVNMSINTTTEEKMPSTIMDEKAVAHRIENADDASTLDNRLAQAQRMSEEEYLDAEKRLKRKLDIRLMAAIWVIYVLNYLDRVCQTACRYKNGGC